MNELNETGLPSGQDSLALAPEQRVLLGAQAPDALANVVLLAEILAPGAAGTLDASVLRAVVSDVIARHTVLRHVFAYADGYRGLRQSALDAAPPLEWQYLDWRGQDDARAVAQWHDDFARAPLALGQGQLIRAALLRLDDGSAILALAASALAADGASLRSLLAQIEAAFHGQADVEPDQPFQYASFVEWRQDLNEDEDSASGRSYWDAQLRALQERGAPRLSYRRESAGATRSQSSGTNAHANVTPSLRAQLLVNAQIDPTLAVKVAGLARAQDVSVETLLQSVWTLLLARLSGYAPCVTGWQHDCRLDYEPMRGGLGVYEKILPVLVDVQPDEYFTGWLGRCAALAESHLEAQEALVLDDSFILGRVTIGFVYGEAQPGRWQPREQSAPVAFELALEVLWNEDGAALTLHANPEHYSRAALEHLSEQYVTLLAAVLAQPAALVHGYDVIGPRERAAASAWQQRADFGGNTVGWHVAQWAGRTPAADAVAADGLAWSYGELLGRVHRLGNWMCTRGVGPGSLVALNMPRSPDLLVAMLATWSAGAAYLPLEPEWPAARREAVLADAQAVLVLHAGAVQLSDASDAAGRTAHSEAALDQIDLGAFSDTAPGTPAGLDALAYVLYTSGSTGKPKGVKISHGALLNYVAAVSAALELNTVRRWALTSTVAADLGNTALFGALFNGACLVVAGAGDTGDGDAFSRFVLRHAIDGLKIVPSHLEALLECAAPHLPRKLVLGGEAAPRALVARIAALAPDCAIYNHYGPTEATVGVLVHAVAVQGELAEVLPLSQPLANNTIRVLDEALRPVPAGAKGELYVGGAQLCQGYLNRSADGAFVADPLQPEARLYRTGDLAYVLPEGGVRLAGRADHQLKIRGYRVEPGEIEALLLNQPGVRQAVVLPVATVQGGLELAAFLMGDATLAADGALAALRISAAALLPAHMVPARLTLLAEFPRLANGKIDRLALASARAQQVPAGVAAPRDALETVLASCMAQVLGRERVGVDEDFFELGGHSLLVIKLVARIRKRLQLELAAAVIFDHSSVAALAAALRKDRSATQLARLEELAVQAVHDAQPGAAAGHTTN
ncbi:amino acid adenylation domain-containing protein [Oxalobacteraceae bacterium]|nr:amino acid adenylation domain-containing protein [Oxalobacteraceae bacterium]